MIRLRTRHLYVDIDRHGQKDDKGGNVRVSRRNGRTHLVIKGYVIDIGDVASLESLADDRPAKHVPTH